MIIILGVVLFISALLYSEVKIIKNIGDSTIAFYAADSGAEKILYYDRQKIPTGAVRGICNICDALDNSFVTGYDSNTCFATPNSTNGCTKCKDCTITFKTTMATTPQKYYNAAVNISTLQREGQCPLSLGQLKSIGTYLNTSRAVYLNTTGDVKTGLGPGMSNPQAIISGNGKITISVTISPYPDCKKDSVTAYIYDQSNGSLVATLELTASGQCNYSKPWQPPGIGPYSISIGAIDQINGFCSSVTVIPV